jgi:hypothetical protein
VKLDPHTKAINRQQIARVVALEKPLSGLIPLLGAFGTAVAIYPPNGRINEFYPCRFQSGGFR